jgi:hypothetical protein
MVNGCYCAATSNVSVQSIVCTQDQFHVFHAILKCCFFLARAGHPGIAHRCKPIDKNEALWYQVTKVQVNIIIWNFGNSCRVVKMESLYRIPFSFLQCPHIKLKKPSWVKQPSPMFMFAVVLLSYFLVTGGLLRFPNIAQRSYDNVFRVCILNDFMIQQSNETYLPF